MAVAYTGTRGSGGIPAETDPLSLHTDQTIPQTIVNGTPTFDKGLKSNDDVIIKAGRKLVLDGN
jgi:hypothetical protein